MNLKKVLLYMFCGVGVVATVMATTATVSEIIMAMKKNARARECGETGARPPGESNQELRFIPRDRKNAWSEWAPGGFGARSLQSLQSLRRYFALGEVYEPKEGVFAEFANAEELTDEDLKRMKEMSETLGREEQEHEAERAMRSMNASEAEPLTEAEIDELMSVVK